MLKLFHFVFLLGLSVAKIKSLAVPNNDATIEWSASLGSQTPGITPLFTKVKNNVVVVSLLETDFQFRLHVRSYAPSGEQKYACQVPLPYVRDKIWEIRAAGLSDSKVIVSWLFNDKDKELDGIRMIILEISDCEFHDVNVDLYKNVTNIHYIPYSIVPYESGAFDLFVKSKKACTQGICRISFVKRGQKKIEVSQILSFADDRETWTWNIVPVDSNDFSKGFYYFYMSDNDSSKIMKLSTNGTVLEMIKLNVNREDIFAFSNNNENLGFCFANSTSRDIKCLQFDSSFNKKIDLAVPLCHKKCSFNVTSIKKLLMFNTKDGGFFVSVMFCVSKFCENHVTTIQKIDASGNLHEPIEFLKSKDGCFPRKNFNIFEFQKNYNKYYCSGLPCMSKKSDNEYNVSIHMKCLKNFGD